MVALFGRAHVMVVHFPVALLMVLALIEVLRWRRKEGSMDQSVAIIAVIAAVSSILAIVQGWMLAGPNVGNSEDAQILELHRWLGISTGVFACASALVALRRQLGDSSGLTKLYRALVIPGAILVSLTGHYGGAVARGRGEAQHIHRPDLAVLQTGGIEADGLTRRFGQSGLGLGEIDVEALGRAGRRGRHQPIPPHEPLGR